MSGRNSIWQLALRGAAVGSGKGRARGQAHRASARHAPYKPPVLPPFVGSMGMVPAQASFVGLPNLAHENIGHPDEFELQINAILGGILKLRKIFLYLSKIQTNCMSCILSGNPTPSRDLTRGHPDGRLGL